MSQRVKLDKKDNLRPLLTDTAPGDVPVVFSNDGLYINLQSISLNHPSTNSSIFFSIKKNLLEATDRQSSPYFYSIRKDEISLRTLALVHPSAQLSFCSYYEQYSETISYLCSRSNYSIRAPKKVANSLYISETDKTTKYKSIDIDTLDTELHRRHSSSYFTYSGYNRLYKFFNSAYYVSLEKRYPTLWMLDVSNCFDSIYTHSISWAIKTKHYSKETIGYRSQFAAVLDKIMQRSNNNETNGITIGSEFSRIFAEIIFQRIDLEIESTITERFGYKLNDQYVLLRYVDDYVLFSLNEKICANVSAAVSDCLKSFNLYINDLKLKKYERPFNTEKSYAIAQAQRAIFEFENKLFSRETGDSGRYIKPQKINRSASVARGFVEHIKNVCHIDDLPYSTISSYLISAISNRMIELADSFTKYSITLENEDEKKEGNRRYRDLLMLYLRVMFFFYVVNPQVSASQKLAKTIIIVDRFFKKHSSDFLDYYRTRVMSEIKQLKLDITEHEVRARFVSIETLNVLTATSDFGPNFSIDETVLLRLLQNTKDKSYFTIVSVLYYVKDNSELQSVRNELETHIRMRVLGGSDLSSDSEAAHLFLDAISCPYVSFELRKDLLDYYLGRFESDKTFSAQEKDTMLTNLLNVFWFVKWQNLDLIKLLERKELHGKY